MNSVSQQIGSAIGVAVIGTFVATATTSYLTSHPVGGAAEATVHGFGVGYWWAAGVFVVAAVICGLLIRPKTYAHHHTGAELGDEAILMIGWRARTGLSRASTGVARAAGQGTGP